MGPRQLQLLDTYCSGTLFAQGDDPSMHGKAQTRLDLASSCLAKANIAGFKNTKDPGRSSAAAALEH